MSVHDAHRNPSSLTQQPAKHLVATQPRAAGSEGRAAASVATSSPPGSLASLGSPPAAELRLSDSSPLLLPLTLSAPAWDAHLASLPPHLESGLAKPASEGLMARLSRTDSANHVHEVEALQQVWLRRSNSVCSTCTEAAEPQAALHGAGIGKEQWLWEDSVCASKGGGQASPFEEAAGEPPGGRLQ